MRIQINGQDKDFADNSNLKELIERFCRDTRHVIAEVNGQVIKNHLWPEQTLRAGDKVELINFVGGG